MILINKQFFDNIQYHLKYHFQTLLVYDNSDHNREV